MSPSRLAAPLVWDRLPAGGTWVRPASGTMLDVVDPASLELCGRVPLANAEDAAAAVATARDAFDRGGWRHAGLDARVKAVGMLLAELVRRREQLVSVIVGETGLPSGGTTLSGTGTGQVDGALELIRASVEAAEAYPWRRETDGRAGHAHVVAEPVGVVVAIVPWNGPLWSALMKVVPALLAGCSVIVKPSPLAPLDAMVLAECAERAGLEPGVVSVVPGDRESSEALVADPRVDKVSFTGSTAVGRQVAARCAANLTRVNLELGGKSAAVVLDDADLDAVLPVLLCGGLDNNGESCTALTRVVVDRRRARELVDRLVAAVGALTVGDPFDPAVDVGPLISEAQRDRVERFVAGARHDGCRLAVGGVRHDPGLPGWFYAPTVLTGVDNAMTVAREEIFGPVLSVIECDGDDEAAAIADDSPYGLSGAVFSADLDRALRLCDRVRTGTLNVNGFTINIDAPLGGFKQSGYGREYGPWGVHEFVEMKTINLFGRCPGRPGAAAG